MKEEKNSNLSFEDLRTKYLINNSPLAMLNEYLFKGWKLVFLVISFICVVIAFFVSKRLSKSIFTYFKFDLSNILFMFFYAVIWVIALNVMSYIATKIIFGKVKVERPSVNDKKIFVRSITRLVRYLNKLILIKNQQYYDNQAFAIYDDINCLRILIDETRVELELSEGNKTSNLITGISVGVTLFVGFITSLPQMVPLNLYEYTKIFLIFGVIVLGIAICIYELYLIVFDFSIIKKNNIIVTNKKKSRYLKKYYNFLMKRYLELTMDQKKNAQIKVSKREKTNKKDIVLKEQARIKRKSNIIKAEDEDS